MSNRFLIGARFLCSLIGEKTTDHNLTLIHIPRFTQKLNTDLKNYLNFLKKEEKFEKLLVKPSQV